MSDDFLNGTKIEALLRKKRLELIHQEEEDRKKKIEEYEQAMETHKLLVMASASRIDQQIKEALIIGASSCPVAVTIPADKNLDVSVFGDALCGYITGDLRLRIDAKKFESQTPMLPMLLHRDRTWVYATNYAKRKWYQRFKEKVKVSYTFYTIIALEQPALPITEEDFK